MPSKNGRKEKRAGRREKVKKDIIECMNSIVHAILSLTYEQQGRQICRLAEASCCAGEGLFSCFLSLTIMTMIKPEQLMV